MTDIKSMLKKQSSWQQSRSNLSWAEKLHKSVIMRKVQKALHISQKNNKPSDKKPG